MESLDSKSKFNIYSSFTLSNDDVNVLSLLYAPLIGSDAFTLYMSFQALLERNNLKSEELIHEDFFEIFSLESSLFTKSRQILESMGLLITYKSIELDKYIYIVCPPLSAKNFIKDVTLGLYLSSKVREETFEFIVSHFSIEKFDKSKYENISKSFDESFISNIRNDNTAKKFKYLLNKKPNNGVKIKNYKLDFDKFVKQINTDFLEFGITETFKKQILNISFVYGFEESDLINLYNDSISKRGFFDHKLFKKNSNILFKYKRKANAPKLEIKNDDEYEYSDLYDLINNGTPEEIIKSVMGNCPAEYLDIVDSLYNELDLDKGVIHCMIIKALRINDFELPKPAYFKKMLKTWVKDNIFDTESAMKYITGELETEEVVDKNAGFEVL